MYLRSVSEGAMAVWEFGCNHVMRFLVIRHCLWIKEVEDSSFGLQYGRMAEVNSISKGITWIPMAMSMFLVSTFFHCRLSHQLGDPSAYMADNATCHRSLAMLSKLRRASKFCGSQLVLLISTLLKKAWTCWDVGWSDRFVLDMISHGLKLC